MLSSKSRSSQMSDSRQTPTSSVQSKSLHSKGNSPFCSHPITWSVITRGNCSWHVKWLKSLLFKWFPWFRLLNIWNYCPLCCIDYISPSEKKLCFWALYYLCSTVFELRMLPPVVYLCLVDIDALLTPPFSFCSGLSKHWLTQYKADSHTHSCRCSAL